MSQDFPQAPLGLGAGSRVAGYLLEEQIGQGGMAVVYRALDERLDRRVALKILAPALAADEAFRQRFIRESRAAAAVDDPHIIPVFEAGEASGVLFIAMRFVRGGDVRSLMQQSGPLPPGRVAEIVSQIAAALDAAHSHGLVHRDVKPANMLLDSSGGSDRPDHVYLSDFGLSKGALQTSGLTGTGQFLGTLDYIAPEQIEGKPVDGRTDEYALACAAYELLSGVPPFQREQAMAVIYAQLSEPPPQLTSRRPDLPPATDEVFARALAKTPGDRYATCREFCDAMRGALGIRPYDSGPGHSPGAHHVGTEVASWPGGAPAAAGVGSHAGTGGGAGAAVMAGDGGPATALAPRDARDTTPGLTEAHGPAGPAESRRSAGGRSKWRSPGALISALVLLVALGGAGAYLAFSGGKKTVARQVAVLPPPGPNTTAAPGQLLSVPATATTVGSGNPFGVQVSADGKYVFAVTPISVAVLVRGPGLTFARQYGYTVTTPDLPARGMAMTSDGKYLLVAVGNGIDVLSVADAELGLSSANVATLTVPNVTGYAGAAEVALSPGDQFAFVTLQNKAEIAVFDLRKALASGPGGFSTADYVGSVRTGSQPMGMAVSPDGKWLYVTSSAAQPGHGPQPGVVSVLSMAAAESASPSSVVGQAIAGSSPVRVLASPDGKMVWVTARQSNYLLGFSAALLRTKPKDALKVKVEVGQTPTGLVLVDGGKMMIVADADTFNTGPTAHNLAVVSITAALARKSALLGYIKSGSTPLDLALVPGGKFLVVSDNGSAQIQMVNISNLP